MNKVDRPNGALARNVRRVGHLDLPGVGQVNIAGNYAYVGHIPNKGDLGTTIVDIADPANPRVVATVPVDDPTSHSHKVRVAGDLMIVNHERNPTAAGRRAQDMPAIRRGLRESLQREPTRAETPPMSAGSTVKRARTFLPVSCSRSASNDRRWSTFRSRALTISASANPMRWFNSCSNCLTIAPRNSTRR